MSVLDQTLPFTPENLQKLSTVCDPRISALAISRSTESDGYQIWGIGFFAAASDLFTEIPVSLGSFLSVRPDVLTVTVLSPGSMVISRGNGQIGRFLFGDFVPATPTPFASKAMGNDIISRIKTTQRYERHGVQYWHFYRDALQFLLREASARGHGGTLIVVPETEKEDWRSWFHARYSVTGSLQIGALIEQILSTANVGEMVVNLGWKHALHERLTQLAQLASADGALLLTRDFEPIAFGATLTAPEWRGEIIVGPDGFGGGGEKFDLVRLGTRHNSAANFVGACESCFGFVISADGPVRGFVRKDAKTLYCWPDCTVSMFV
jgi:hypothetical protein